MLGKHWLLSVLLPIGLALTACGPEELSEEELEDPVAVELALSEGAAMQAFNASCLQLKDTGTWNAYATNIGTVGTAVSLAGVLGDLNRSGPVLTSSTRPVATGINGGFQWQSDDMAATSWTPQALTGGTVGDKSVTMVGWYHDGSGGVSKGVRISIADTTTLTVSAVKYRHVLLVEPTTAGNFRAVVNHGGGLAKVGDYLYEADTSRGLRVFDLTRIRRVSTAAACDTRIGQYGSTWCAYGYEYVLPQVGGYYMPAARSNGVAISALCKPKFSWIGKDTRATTDYLLSGEYCKANDTSSPCDYSPSSGLAGRLYRWPMASGGRLNTVNGYVTPQKAWFMNQRNVQGVAPIMTKNSSGAYPTDAYWLSSTLNHGSLFRVSPYSSSKRFIEDYGQCVKMPEGMHAAAAGTNLYIVTEGVSGVTNPRTGGRIVARITQSSVD